MSRIKLVIGAVLLLVIVGLVVSWLLPPSSADYDDYFTEDIGGDGFLVANFTGCLKLGEEDIPHGKYASASGCCRYFDAKNITYVDTAGRKDYAIVWKTSADNYDFPLEDLDNDTNYYNSDYLTEIEGKCFIIHCPSNNSVYGIIVGTDKIPCSESKLLFDILGLDKNEFDLVYSQQGSSSSYYSSYSEPYQSHYHTVIPDRYTLSRTDPGAYYDNYEYGDNYDIDDYLESEGYD